jgi:competence protein ComEC
LDGPRFIGACKAGVSRYAFDAMRFSQSLTACVLAFAAVTPLNAASRVDSLRIYAVDVEGGQATLFVAPGGQSLLVDTGWPGNDGRDADRIVAAAKEAGLSRIDTVLLTHFHMDHIGGVPQLAERFPIGTFLDHGQRIPTDPDPPAPFAEYQKVLATGKYKHVVVRAGEKLPIAGFDAIALSSNGSVMNHDPKASRAPESANPLCGKTAEPVADTSENGQSLGILLRFGGLKIVDGGDLTADRERMLVCPVNKVGMVDLMIVSHHGVDWSSSRVFVDSLQPRVAIMDNGDHKGASTSVIDTLRKSPRMQALYQLHLAPAAGSKNPGGTLQEGPEHNVLPEYIANTAGVDGKRVDIVIHSDGSMDVTNGRTGQTKHFPKL